MLAVFVVFIHNNFTKENVAKTFAETGRVIVFNQSVFGEWVQQFISGGIASCAVPLFFLFAAFLQAKKSDRYPTLLKKKAKSMLLPYALWLSIYFLYYGVLKLVLAKIAPQLLGTPDETFLTWTAKDWFHNFIGYNPELGVGEWHPQLAGQLWFVRDLMILSILSPIFMTLIKKFPVGFLTLVFVVYILKIEIYFVGRPQALFFYVAGLYWGTFGTPLFKIIDKIKWSESAALFLASFVFDKLFAGTSMRWFMVLFICILVLKLSKPLAENEKAFLLAKKLSVYSFFLYAVHMPVLNTLLKQLWLKFFPMTNTFFCLFEYFGVTAITIIVAIGIGALLRKICPPLFALLNGGRG